MKHGIYEDLKEWLSDAEKVVVAGIGNPIRSDDFLGVKIIQGLHGKVSENVLLIECETVPESFTQQILDFDPTHVLLIDAAILGLKPGESRLLDSTQLQDSPAFSTHTLPMRIFCEYIMKMGKAKIGLVLVEPKETDFGEGLSREVDVAVRKIIHDLLKALPRRQASLDFEM
jgi:hydrogenase 3 maturation protease